MIFTHVIVFWPLLPITENTEDWENKKIVEHSIEIISSISFAV